MRSTTNTRRLAVDGRDDRDLVGTITVDDVADRRRRAAIRRRSATAVTVSAPRASAPVIEPAATPPSHARLLLGVAAVRRSTGANCVVVATNGDGSLARPSSSSRIASSIQLMPETAVLLGDRQRRPVELDHRVPPAGGVDAVVDHRADERRRALLVDDAAHGVLQLALVVVEFEIHALLRLASVSRCGSSGGRRRWKSRCTPMRMIISLRRETYAKMNRRRHPSLIGVGFERLRRGEHSWGCGTNRTC